MSWNRLRAVTMALWFLLIAGESAADAAVVTLDSQERTIDAHIMVVSGMGLPVPDVSRGNKEASAAAFGDFSKEVSYTVLSNTREPYAVAWAYAQQTSSVLGSTIHADGKAGGGGAGTLDGFGRGWANCTFLVRFTVHEPCTVEFRGNAFRYGVPAEIFLTGPTGIVWHSGIGSVQGPFDLPPQVLEPGQYTLHAVASGGSYSGFSLDLVLDAPLVAVQPVTWTRTKSLYR